MSSLVEISSLIPDIKLDIRYGSTNNVLGQILYSNQTALLIKDVIYDLANVQNELSLHGYGLYVWDAYRPHSLTKKLWDLTEVKNEDFLANPIEGSIHNRGCAIDTSLWDFKNNKLVDMPTDFDDFSDKANAKAINCTDDQIINRDLLIRLMTENNFQVNDKEWWHFDWNRWQEFPILDMHI